MDTTNNKVRKDQIWMGVNGYGAVRISRVSKDCVFFYPKQGGGSEHKMLRTEFSEKFSQVL